jgi:hypothetical protein
MALSADTRPHFTTIAGFVAELEGEIVQLFRDVLLYGEELGLIGKEHFAIDGCKLPSNASKQWSGTHFRAPQRACRPCELRAQCLRHPERTVQRQVMFFHGRVPGSRRPSMAPPPVIEAMKRKIDTPLGRAIYARRIATVEPVFANIQNKGMRRFTLRGRGKVSTQWRLFTLVHNIEKIAHAKAA